MENNKEIERNEVVSVNYSQPKFWHRVMANFVDFFLMLVTFVLLFIGARSIVLTTPKYKQAEQTIYDTQLNSGLYMPDATGVNKTVDIVYYIDNHMQVYGSDFAGTAADTNGNGVIDDNELPTGKIGRIVYAINKFMDYCNDPNVTSNERYQDLVVYYESARLDTLTSDGIHYFVKDGDNIIPNETLSSDPEKRKLYYDNVYVPLVEKKFLPFITSNIPAYRDAYRVEFNFLVFLELPVSYALAGFLVYFVPPLFFKRGRKTLGKALYHIGLLDSRVLSPTFARFTARFAIFFFGELILSLFTFGIPYIISFSIMAFSKDKQGFPDYMLHLYEIDTSKASIYLDYVEAQLKNELHGEAVDFKMERPL